LLLSFLLPLSLSLVPPHLQFQALGLPEKRQLLGAVSRLLIRGFASVLQDLHKLGILHLDGKPSNVVFQVSA
jgi:serine/threonine protein kinase